MLTLRRFRAEDAEAICRLLNDDEVSLYLSDSIVSPYTLERAERFVRASFDGFPLDCAIDVDGEIAGAINLMEKHDVYRASLEVGYWIGRPYWGLGIAREALRQIMRVAFRERDVFRVYANVFLENKASCRVLESCGFRREGIHLDSLIKRGRFYDSAVYATRRDEWRRWDELTPQFSPISRSDKKAADMNYILKTDIEKNLQL